MAKRIISLEALNETLGSVQDEMIKLGFWTEKMYEIDIFLTTVPGMTTLGYHLENPWWITRRIGFKKGNIYIPAVTLSRLFTHGTSFQSLRDILRHEYGHGFAYKYPMIVRRSRDFRELFGDRYDSGQPFEYNPDFFLTEYAATQPSEDFAECFMVVLKCRGKITRYKYRKGLYRKLRWIKSLRALTMTR